MIHQTVVAEGERSVTSPKLREAHFGDYHAIVQLATKHGLPPEPWESWVHLWTGNPAYTPGMPIGWVLDHRGELVGWFGNIPLHYELNGELARTATPRSWVVDERFRGYAPLLADAFLHQPNVELVVSTTGNQFGSAALAALGAQPVPQQIKPEAAFWITGHVGFAAAYLRWKGISDPYGVLAYVGAGVLHLGDALSSSLPRHAAVQRRTEFGPEFDKFWHDLRRVRGKVLLGRRDRAALEWHFGAALHKGSAWLFVCAERGHITSYAVFLRSDHIVLGLRRMILADFQQLGESTDGLGGILQSASALCRANGIHALEIVGSHLESSNLVRKLTAHNRKMSPGSFSYLYDAIGPLKLALRDAERWDLTFFDGDSSLSPTEI